MLHSHISQMTPESVLGQGDGYHCWAILGFPPGVHHHSEDLKSVQDPPDSLPEKVILSFSKIWENHQHLGDHRGLRIPGN